LLEEGGGLLEEGKSLNEDQNPSLKQQNTSLTSLFLQKHRSLGGSAPVQGLPTEKESNSTPKLEKINGAQGPEGAMWLNMMESMSTKEDDLLNRAISMTKSTLTPITESARESSPLNPSPRRVRSVPRELGMICPSQRVRTSTE